MPGPARALEIPRRTGWGLAWDALPPATGSSRDHPTSPRAPTVTTPRSPPCSLGLTSAMTSATMAGSKCAVTMCRDNQTRETLCVFSWKLPVPVLSVLSVPVPKTSSTLNTYRELVSVIDNKLFHSSLRRTFTSRSNWLEEFINGKPASLNDRLKRFSDCKYCLTPLCDLLKRF